jgi:hypothetical protein
MNFKTVLLAAAALGVAGTAQAADLAKKAPAAANYVKVCDAYGAGFFYIPGSDTCLKIGGFVRAQYNAFSTNKNWGGIVGWNNRAQAGIGTFVRADVTIDARSNTELGLLRSFIDFEINSNSFGNGSTNAVGLSAGVTLNKAFVQFGGLTAGRAQSFFDFWTGNTYGSWFEPAHSDTNINLLAYTFSFGNGISATLSLEDRSSGNAGRMYTTGGTAYAGVKSTDVVANVNIAQAWGSAQIMGAIHDDYATVNGKVGYAVGAGVTVNLPMLGASDSLSLQGVYSKGAVSYAAPDWSGAYTYDFWANGTTIEQTTAWSIAAGFTHSWTKTLSSSLEASYAKFDASNANNDYAQIDLQANVVWAPVTNLTIGAELEYRKLDYTAATPRNDADALIGLIRVQRNF